MFSICYNLIVKKNEGKILSVIIIIVGLILCLTVLGFWRQDSEYGLISYRKTLNLPCGITVYGPKDGDEPKTPLRVYGYANGCGWDLENGSIGTVEVLASNGIVLYRGDLPKNQKDNDFPIYFEKDILFRAPLGHTKGMVIIKNNKKGFTSNVIQIPILFN